ncbi:MAG: hypothetical protein ACKOPS_03950, partial [Cyanobium sp.]
SASPRVSECVRLTTQSVSSPTAQHTMSSPQLLPVLTPMKARLDAIDRMITRRENLLSFLVIRLVLMSGMVVGFSWWALHLSP